MAPIVNSSHSGLKPCCFIWQLTYTSEREYLIHGCFVGPRVTNKSLPSNPNDIHCLNCHHFHFKLHMLSIWSDPFPRKAISNMSLSCNYII